MTDFTRILRNLVVIVALIVPAIAQAEDWPAKPVTTSLPAPSRCR